MSVTIKDIDRGFKRLKKTVEEFKGGRGRVHVKVGVLGKSKEREGGKVSNVDLAMIHEFGAPEAGIPERPFIRGSYDKHEAEYGEFLKKGLTQVFAGKMSAKQALGLVGAKAASDVKAYVTSGPQIPPPNSERVWLEKMNKGADKLYSRNAKRKKPIEGPFMPKKTPRTLVDSGQMVNSVTWQVVGVGEGE